MPRSQLVVRSLPTGFLALVLLLAAADAGAQAPSTDPREATLRTLKEIEANEEIGLEAWIEGSVAEQVRVGDPVDFRFDTRQPVYLTTLYIDAAGTLTVLHMGDEKAQLRPGAVMSFPDPQSGKHLVVQPPLGRETVFAIATREPLPQDLFADADREKVQVVHETPKDARHFAQRIADYVSILPEGSVDVAFFSHEVVPEDTPQRYAATQIVEHFTTATRSLSRRKLDLDIQFETNSDRLTPQAKHDLDELGRALEHPAMKDRRFELAGHTDDVGSAPYNMELSKRRAQSAYEYLTKRYEIAPGAVQTAGYGEERPVMEGTSDDARRRNRRVVIEQLP